MAHRRARFLTTLLRQCTAAQTTHTLALAVGESSSTAQRGIARVADAHCRVDARRASSVPQPEPQTPFFFKVRIITGNVRGAGTRAGIRLQLIGTRGESEPAVISQDRGFAQGSVKDCILPVETDIGALRMVRVEREIADGSLADESWFLDKLLVEDQSGHQLCFPCMQWFGLSACGQIAGLLNSVS